MDIHTLIASSEQQQQQASDSSVPTPFCCVTFVARWTLAGSPGLELPSVGEGDDCVLLGGMSSSRSPTPLPRTRTTQLHGDRRWQGPGAMILFPNVSLSRGKSTTRFGWSAFFRRKVTIFIGRETKIHILLTKINENKNAKVSRSNNNYSFRIL